MTLNLPECSEILKLRTKYHQNLEAFDIKALELPMSFRMDLTGKAIEYQ